tara:strand:+ start:526 stop:870 length:345 start_codon:yes stop_codon:yes gene_type:complete
MKWQIDKENELLILDGDYEIAFDRLQEGDWFKHLAEKRWIDMDELFKAFVSAFRAAELPLTKDFFAKFKLAYMRNVDDKFYDLIFNLRHANDTKLFRKVSDFKSEQELIKEIVA